MASWEEGAVPGVEREVIAGGGEEEMGGAAGGLGAGGGAGPSDMKHRVKRMTSAPRPSSSVQMQLKVIRHCMERMMQEREDLFDIKDMLRHVLKGVDKEIIDAQRMLKLGMRASAFQHGQSMPTNFSHVPNLQPIGPPGDDNSSIVSEMSQEYDVVAGPSSPGSSQESVLFQDSEISEGGGIFSQQELEELLASLKQEMDDSSHDVVNLEDDFMN